ncbi:hypothetical protein D0Z08_19380 [Nocardioides immobilis]|uniref:Uncharacterized protein n=1 Tax=Nocardioides immobilis TaxID=2049295 RepID=A0A417XYF7_9ACTN|nr:hypothetical protein D0Z08_19380 [Nocardioides immobilis]
MAGSGLVFPTCVITLAHRGQVSARARTPNRSSGESATSMLLLNCDGARSIQSSPDLLAGVQRLGHVLRHDPNLATI